jgi:hypothetical protein
MSTRRRSLRSIIVLVVVFLLLGAVVNVAVAWGCANAAGGEWDAQWDGSEYTRVWLEHGGSVDAEGPDADSCISRPGYEAHYTNFWRPNDGEYTDMFIFRAGWPTPSLDGIAMRIWRSAVAFDRVTDGVLLSEKAWGANDGMYGAFETAQRSMPLHPVWPGFVINTFFYAAILWLLFAGPGRVRRWRRIKRGLCAKCAYPVGASDICTECGASVAKSRLRAR